MTMADTLTLDDASQLGGFARRCARAARTARRLARTEKPDAARALLDFAARAAAAGWHAEGLALVVHERAGTDTDADLGSFRPDWTVAPAVTFRRWLSEHSMTIGDLAEAVTPGPGSAATLALFQGVLNQQPYGEETVTVLARATGSSREFWRDREHDYRAGLAAGHTDTTPPATPMSADGTTAVSTPAGVRQTVAVRTKGELVGHLIGMQISCFDAYDLADLVDGEEYAVDLGTHACGGRALDGPHHDPWIIALTGGWWLLVPAPGDASCLAAGCDGTYAPRPHSADRAPGQEGTCT
jgi:hypothetical protein